MPEIGRMKLFLFFSACLLLPVAETAGDASSRRHRLETKHTIIRYTSSKDLKKFSKKIDYTPGEWNLKSLFSPSGSSSPAESAARKVDALYERVQHILEMYGSMKEKVSIHIYPNKKGLHRAYFDITRRSCNVRSWYIYERNTVYVNVEDVNEGMLAHELAHAIIDHYLIVRPPRATAEILARYVDAHLNY
jgi:hypothetical protein